MGEINFKIPSAGDLPDPGIEPRSSAYLSHQGFLTFRIANVLAPGTCFMEDGCEGEGGEASDGEWQTKLLLSGLPLTSCCVTLGLF